MIHAVAYILFILPFTAWLGWELKRSYDLKEHWPWLAGTFITGVLGAAAYNIHSDVVGNFILHASGGFASTLLFTYLFRTLGLRFNWRLTALLLFAFVCMLGVLNELAEYFFDLLGLGPFSFDTHDTWRDFVANTTGAVICWTAIKIIWRKKSPF